MEEASERKKLPCRRSGGARLEGGNASSGSGFRGFVAKSTTRPLREEGVRGLAHRKAAKALSNAAERSSHRLWLKRRDPNNKCQQ